MSKYTTIQQAFEWIRVLDAETAITYHALRQMVISGQMPRMRVGKKYLIDLDALTSLLNAQVSQDHSLDFTPGQSDL